MTQGDALVRDGQGFIMHHPTNHHFDERIHPLTVSRLLREGYLERGGSRYHITPKGRAALAEAP